MAADAREIAQMVPMPRLFEALRIEANERSRRGPCPIHGGKNPNAFSWRDDGRWHCFSCGRGGDRIALVRSVRQCGFRQAVTFLAALAGVEYRPQRVSRTDLERVQRRRARVDRAAWRIHDEVVRLRGYYGDALRRTERLQARIGKHLKHVQNEGDSETVWNRLALLASPSSFFLAAFNHVNSLNSAGLVRFALMPAGQRRATIFGDGRAHAAIAA
jgi:DNA primase